MSSTPARASAEPFARELRTDVLIVGGGINGVCVSYFLALEGVETVLIERADYGAGSSSANSGNLHEQLLADNYYRFGWEWFARWAAIGSYFSRAATLWRMLAERHRDGVEIVSAGGLMVAEEAEDLRFLERKVKLERASGCEVRIVRGNELRDLAGYLSDKAIGAAFCPGEGHVNPLTALPTLLEAAEATGALRAFRHCELLDLKAAPAGFLARTARGPIAAKRVVNAAGADAGAISARLGLALPLRERIAQSIVTEPVAPFLPHMVYHARGLFTLKQLAPGHLVIGGGWPARLDERTGLAVTTRASLVGSLRRAAATVPIAGELRMLRSWAGKLFTCDDGFPVLGEAARVTGFYHAVPNVFGLTLAPLIGQLIAELATGKRPQVDIAPFALERAGLSG